jgi:hypothetical protein
MLVLFPKVVVRHTSYTTDPTLFIETKGVGRGATLAWPGWKQSVIAVEVDTGRLETSRFKKCYANCVLLYFPSTEIKSAFNVY